MNDRIKLFLNCDEELQKRIKIFIDYFVRYYGEDKREEVEQKLSQTLYIGYTPPKSKSRLVDKLLENENDRIQQDILDKVQFPLDKKDLFNNMSFKYESLIPLFKLTKLKEIHDKGKKQRLNEFIEEGYEYVNKYYKMSKLEFLGLRSTEEIPKKFHPLIEDGIRFYLNKDNSEHDYKKAFEDVLPLLQKIDPNITIEGLDAFFADESVMHLLSMYAVGKEQYNAFVEENKQYVDLQQQNEKLETLLNEKYYLLFIKENIDLLPEKDRQPIYDYIEGKSKSLNRNAAINSIFGYALNSTPDLCYFDEKHDKELAEADVDWKSATIKRNRINYFNSIGINLGEDYEAYVNSKECQERWPSKELIERVVNSKNKFTNKLNNEFFEKIAEFKAVRDRIEQAGLLDREDSFNAKLLTDSGTFINPNIRLTDKGYELCSLFVICFDSLNSDNLDHNIVHELNHLYELALSSVDLEKYEMIVGWDYASGKIGQKRNEEVDTINIDKSKRKYELFNEIINELIAQEICEMMHNDNVTVFDEPGNSRYKRTTSYEDYLVLVKDFYKEFKDIIIESRRNGNVQVIYDAIGEENFNELNEIIKIFYENFKGMTIYSLRRALNNNEDNEMTRVYYELIERRDKILDNMRSYKQEEVKVM